MIFLVARREVTERLRQRSFQYSLLATIVLVVAIAWLAGVLGGDDTETYRVGAQGPEAVAIAQAARAAAPQLDAEIEVERFGSAAQARAAVEDESVDAALVEGTVVSLEDPEDALDQALQAGARQVRIGEALRSEGVPADDARGGARPAASAGGGPRGRSGQGP